MNIPTILPKGLNSGDAVAIVAPAGPLRERDALDKSAVFLEEMGFEVRFDDRIFHQTAYLAGSDDARAEELMGAFEDDSVKAVVGLRGGYGCSRLIPYLDLERLKGHPKIFMGFSDLTTLHLFLYRRLGWVTFHGPMAANPGIGSHSDEEHAHLLSLWTDPAYRPALSFPQLEAWNSGKAEGRLVGGCLSTIVSSIGTPYEIDTNGAILFLEDVGEPPYRLDRMLTHLKLAGKFESLRGILLGRFFEGEPPDGADSGPEMMKELLRSAGVPILANFPAGHGPHNWALPMGSRIRIDGDALSVEFLEPSVR